MALQLNLSLGKPFSSVKIFANIDAQMAKRMKYSVVGLPHYVIWHLYEPSIDDIEHMEVRYERKFHIAVRARADR